MASKKGFILTAAIAAAVIGASSIVWFVPQSSIGNFSNPRTPQDVFSSVYSQSNDQANIINATFQKWQQGQVSSQVMIDNITLAEKNTLDMKNKLVNSNPPSEYQNSFSTYESALDSFSTYLSKIKAQVDSGTKGQNQEVAAAWGNWQKQIDQAVGSLPVGS